MTASATHVRTADIVCLVYDDGTLMTVERIDARGAHCVWFEACLVKRGVYHPNALLVVWRHGA